MAKKPELPEPEPKKKPARVLLCNPMTQKLIVNIKNAAGGQSSVEIKGKGEVPWPMLEDYGPHVVALRKSRQLILKPHG